MAPNLRFQPVSETPPAPVAPVVEEGGAVAQGPLLISRPLPPHGRGPFLALAGNPAFRLNRFVSANERCYSPGVSCGLSGGELP